MLLSAMAKASGMFSPPSQVLFALVDLGSACSLARLARGDTQAQAAERCGFHMQTVARIESGDPSVAISKVFTLLSYYGLGSRLFDLSQTDEVTQVLIERAVAKRGRRTVKTKPP